MSLKQWANGPRPKTEDVEAFWDASGGRPRTSASLGIDADGDAHARRACTPRAAARRARALPTPAA